MDNRRLYGSLKRARRALTCINSLAMMALVGIVVDQLASKTEPRAGFWISLIVSSLTVFAATLSLMANSSGDESLEEVK